MRGEGWSGVPVGAQGPEQAGGDGDAAPPFRQSKGFIRSVLSRINFKSQGGGGRADTLSESGGKMGQRDFIKALFEIICGLWPNPKGRGTSCPGGGYQQKKA